MGSGDLAPPILTSSLGGVVWSTSCPDRFPLRGNCPQYPLNRRLDAPRCWSGLLREERCWPVTLVGNRTQTIQPVAHRYADLTSQSVSRIIACIGRSRWYLARSTQLERYSRFEALTSVWKKSKWDDRDCEVRQCLMMSEMQKHACSMSIHIVVLTELNNESISTKFLDTCTKTVIDVTTKTVLFKFVYNIFISRQLMITIQTRRQEIIFSERMQRKLVSYPEYVPLQSLNPHCFNKSLKCRSYAHKTIILPEEYRLLWCDAVWLL
jgi:hypothetical protein